MFSQAESWDPRFIDRSPMFAPLAAARHTLPPRGCEWPERSDLESALTSRAVVSGGGHPLRPVPPPGKTLLLDYETRCFLTGELETRENSWHDLFNALVWLTFPL